jgi:hypothetical protein
MNITGFCITKHDQVDPGRIVSVYKGMNIFLAHDQTFVIA